MPVEMLFLRKLLMTAFKEIFPQIVFNFTIGSQEKEKIKRIKKIGKKSFILNHPHLHTHTHIMKTERECESGVRGREW